MMEYYYETEEILIGCIGIDLDIYINTFSKRSGFGTPKYIEKIVNTNSGIITKGNFILSQNKYNLFTVIEDSLYLENINELIFPCIKRLNAEIINPPTDETSECTNGFYNYNKTSCIDTIPDGYYCNDTIQRTIDKCHDNCKTCNQSATIDNNNCLTCKDSGPIYLDLGNCIDNCVNTFY
jgi:hypothetical protein